ncbi:MOSC N-terminal beta barrel domain-containing protein [Candidatus Binatus sp.]|uniref:MOSC N-terminal beta barrel domain-containing protein n=1 Tax=Candidatus Binatus sp. TaxID=2811406 RepID=UPI0032C233F3
MLNFEQTSLGAAEELWRYPVKSMIGERLSETEVKQRGLLGDRAYALRDTSDGKSAMAWRALFSRTMRNGAPARFSTKKIEHRSGGDGRI